MIVGSGHRIGHVVGHGYPFSRPPVTVTVVGNFPTQLCGTVQPPVVVMMLVEQGRMRVVAVVMVVVGSAQRATGQPCVSVEPASQR